MMNVRSTDSNGEYRLENIAAGPYYLSASKRGIMSLNQEVARKPALQPGAARHGCRGAGYAQPHASFQPESVGCGCERSRRHCHRDEWQPSTGNIQPGGYIVTVTNTTGIIKTFARLQALAELIGVVELDLDPKTEAAAQKAKAQGKERRSDFEHSHHPTPLDSEVYGTHGQRHRNPCRRSRTQSAVVTPAILAPVISTRNAKPIQRIDRILETVRLPRTLIPLALSIGFLQTAHAQNLKEFEKRVTEFTLPNGLHFIVLERHDAPVVSFHTYVNAGAVDDPKGKTGIAHMFEHMAFKGTENVGSANWPAEKAAMDRIEVIYDQLDAERNKGPKADPDKLKALQEKVHEQVEKASSYVVPNLYARIIEENGGVGMNASTAEDSTDYFYNFPANRAELWFYLEAGRFTKPVYREFYKERDVVREERRMRVESDPQGKLMEALQSTAIEAHPYRNGPGGWASDIENLRVGDAEKFFKTYYVAANISIAIVGDVDPARMKSLATKYFGPLPKRPLPAPVLTLEPMQEGPKRAEVISPSQPLEFLAYHRPDQHDADDPVFDVVSAILSSGRTSMMYRDLVRDKKLALAAESDATFPGGKYPGLFIFILAPNAGHTLDECEKELDVVIARLQAEKVDAATLARVKTKTRAGVLKQLDNNAGLAQLLTQYYVNYGDWRKLFTAIDDIEKVTAEDVQRVAKQYFKTENRTVARTIQPAVPAAAGEGK